MPDSNARKESGMLLKTILNRIQKHPGFVYGPIRLQQDGVELLLQVVIRPRAKGHPPILLTNLFFS